MKASTDNRPWTMEAFLDSLTMELDKYVDTLSYKGINRKLTYTVKDLSLDLKLFPVYDGDKIRFTTARPGDTGASTISLQLGSIRDTQIREIARPPLTRDDISLEAIDMPNEERRELKKLGISSVADLQRATDGRNVDLEQVTRRKVNYRRLANLIRQSRAPQVSRVSLSRSQGKTQLSIQGDNLVLSRSPGEFPVALLNDEAVEVASANDQEVKLWVQEKQLRSPANQLAVALDPYAVITMELKDTG